MFPTYESFSKVFDECTRDHRAMVLDNTQSNTDISECVFWYKAQSREPFTLYSQKFWAMAAQRTIIPGAETPQKSVAGIISGKERSTSSSALMNLMPSQKTMGSR